MARNSHNPLPNRHDNAEPTDVDSDPSRAGIHEITTSGPDEPHGRNHASTAKRPGSTGPSDDPNGLQTETSVAPSHAAGTRQRQPSLRGGESHPMPVHDVSRAR
jgi:hypothetical protein